MGPIDHINTTPAHLHDGVKATTTMATTVTAILRSAMCVLLLAMVSAVIEPNRCDYERMNWDEVSDVFENWMSQPVRGESWRRRLQMGPVVIANVTRTLTGAN